MIRKPIGGPFCPSLHMVKSTVIVRLVRTLNAYRNNRTIEKLIAPNTCLKYVAELMAQKVNIIKVSGVYEYAHTWKCKCCTVFQCTYRAAINAHAFKIGRTVCL